MSWDSMPSSFSDGLPGSFPPSPVVSESGVQPPNPTSFSRPPSDFDQTRARNDHARSLTSSRTEPSVEDEINDQIARLEALRQQPLSEAERLRVADTIRGIREGGWIEALKPALVGKDSVGIEYWNRLVAEHEHVIAKVAQRNVEANRRVGELEDELVRLRQASLSSADLEARDVQRLQRIQELEDAARDQHTKVWILEAELRDQKRGNSDREQMLKDEVRRLHNVERDYVAAKEAEESAVRRVSALEEELAQAMRAQGAQSAFALAPTNPEPARAENSRLYQSIHTLHRGLGLPGPFVERPETVEQMVQEITGPEVGQDRSPAFTVLNLRCRLVSSRLRTEEVRNQLELAQADARLAQVSGATAATADEMEMLVSSRTQSYRNYRRQIVDHIFTAQNELMRLAESGSDRASLEGLITQLLHPSALPLPTGQP
ncbi:hypothetical protein F5Y17DRAFT_423741 [Xylariaceae sp. FL0594]|nr:hypothetical protein F5Y17DRAFT_423741 [Xylariaceae sp. FL0594]